MQPTFDEESRPLLRKIMERLASRQLASINILGHCLKYIGDLEVKITVASELNLWLRLFREAHALYREFGWQDLDTAVRDRIEAIPYPASRLEFGVQYYVTGVAERVAMQSYTESSCREFAAIARTYVEAAERRQEPTRFLEYCQDPANRPQAQQFFDRWVRIGLESLGKPGSRGDQRAVALGLRSKTSAELVAEYRERLEPFVERCGLTFSA